MRSELAIETLLAVITDHQHHGFDFFSAADEIRGVTHADAREVPMHRIAHLAPEHTRHVSAIAADRPGELANGQPVSVTLFDETDHAADSR